MRSALYWLSPVRSWELTSSRELVDTEETMHPTASRRTASQRIMKTLPLQSTFALASGGILFSLVGWPLESSKR